MYTNYIVSLITSLGRPNFLHQTIRYYLEKLHTKLAFLTKIFRVRVLYSNQLL